MAHTTPEELQSKLQSSSSQITIGDLYYHWRNPDVEYRVLAIGLCEWNEESAVVYQSLADNLVWIRTVDGPDGWNTPVETDHGMTSRFHKVAE